MKYLYFFIYLLCTNITINGMKQLQKIEPFNNSHSLIALSNDIKLSLFNYIVPLSNWTKNPLDLLTIAKTAKALQLVCKSFNTLFSVDNISSLMPIDDLNKDVLLMQATQQGIPCLSKYAISKKAKLNYTDITYKYFRLSIIIRENNYKCCFWLLKTDPHINPKTLYMSQRYSAAFDLKIYFPKIISFPETISFEIKKLLLHDDVATNDKCHSCHKTIWEHVFENEWRSDKTLAFAVKLLIDYGATIPEEYKEEVTNLLAKLK